MKTKISTKKEALDFLDDKKHFYKNRFFRRKTRLGSTTLRKLLAIVLAGKPSGSECMEIVYKYWREIPPDLRPKFIKKAVAHRALWGRYIKILVNWEENSQCFTPHEKYLIYRVIIFWDIMLWIIRPAIITLVVAAWCWHLPDWRSLVVIGLTASVVGLWKPLKEWLTN